MMISKKQLIIRSFAVLLLVFGFVYKFKSKTDSTNNNEELITYKYSNDTLRIVSTDESIYFPFGCLKTKEELLQNFPEFVGVDMANETVLLENGRDSVVFIFDDELLKYQIVKGRLVSDSLGFNNGIKVGQTLSSVIEKYGVSYLEEYKTTKLLIVESGLSGMWHYYSIKNQRVSKIEFKTDYQF